jgi:hypothetical protein
MQEGVHPRLIGQGGKDVLGAWRKSRDLELTAQNSRLLGIKFLIQTKAVQQIEEYSTPHDAPIGKKLGALASTGDCLCRSSLRWRTARSPRRNDTLILLLTLTAA